MNREEAEAMFPEEHLKHFMYVSALEAQSKAELGYGANWMDSYHACYRFTHDVIHGYAARIGWVVPHV